MKSILLLLTFTFSASSLAVVELAKYDLVGIKRILTLKELGRSVEGFAAYVQGRITVQGGEPETETIIVIKDFYNPNINGRYKFYIGNETQGVFLPTGNIQRFRMKNSKAVEYYHSGLKRDLFKYIIQYTKENRDKLTGEVRFIVEPYTSTSPYYPTGTVQFILKE